MTIASTTENNGKSSLAVVGQQKTKILVILVTAQKITGESNQLLILFFYLFSFLLTINLKLIIVHVEIKIVNKEAATKRSTLLNDK